MVFILQKFVHTFFCSSCRSSLKGLREIAGIPQKILVIRSRRDMVKDFLETMEGVMGTNGDK